MFSYILKQLEEADSLLLELGASGFDLTARVESLQNILDPEIAITLVEVSHAVKLPSEFFSENEISNLEALTGKTLGALNKQVFEITSNEFGEYLEQTNHLFEPSMFERIKKLFAVDPKAQSRKMEPSKIILINLLKQQSLSCDRCNSLSIPILDTADRYKCIKCSRQFISAKHHIRHVILDSFKDSWTTQRVILKYYAECVERITDQA